MAELLSGFLCRICGEHHPTLPLSYSIKAPRTAIGVPAAEQARRVVLSGEQCVVDGKRFFLRGRIPVPVHGLAEPFIWGVWAEVGPRDFLRTQELWKREGREHEPAYRGWLDSELALFGDTLNLEVSVETQPVGRRPHFRVFDAEHALAREQREGLTLARVQEIAEEVLHPGRGLKPQHG